MTDYSFRFKVKGEATEDSDLDVVALVDKTPELGKNLMTFVFHSAKQGKINPKF